MRNVAKACLIIALSTVLSCKMRDNEPISASGAQQVEPIRVPKNSKGNTVEQQNINDRLAVTTDPAKVLWIHLIALDGKIVKRMPVRGKVTSSGKRLEPAKVVVDPANSGGNFPAYGGYYTDERIEADGTYGSSDPYIYWFDPMGRYHQWGTAGGLGYLVTDYPIDLENQIDKISGLYNADHAAAAWQAEQEERLRAREGRQPRIVPLHTLPPNPPLPSSAVRQNGAGPAESGSNN
jgi:hypothetical protein